jgi:hypothetical protein
MRRRPDFCGQEYVDLGARIAVRGQLTPEIIGAVSRRGHDDEPSLKRVWHYVARFATTLYASLFRYGACR